MVLTLQSMPTSPTSAEGKPGRERACRQAQRCHTNEPTTPASPSSLLEERLGVGWTLWLGIAGHPRFCIQSGVRHGATMARTMISVNIDRSESVPLHDQVAAEIRRAITEGEARPGERLPLARDIAAVLGVNKNTVLRAMHMLRDEGLVEFGRGRGITVSGTPERSAVVSRVRELVDFARQHGYRRDEVIDMIAGLP